MQTKIRYLVEIAYKGTTYHGWQRQPKVTTVQQTLEEALTKALHTSVICIGCGRTDAMVHASQFYFHIDLASPLTFDLAYRLNKMLPNDISILSYNQVANSVHAQHSATSRTYNYLIHIKKDPQLADLSSLYQLSFNTTEMSKAVRMLASHTNFVNFCRCPSRHSSTICNIYSAKLFTNKHAGMLRFEIKANRFLQGMVRLIVQRLIDVGSGEMPIDELRKMLNNEIKPKKVIAAYPQGLYLSKVDYPAALNIKRENSSPFFQLLSSAEWELLSD